MSTVWETVVGLEIHIQLGTRTKMFCRCESGFGFAPNERTCPVCLGLPGALPIANAEAVESALKLGLQLGCSVAERSVFSRKSYFYQDLPKGYQISQYNEPLCSGGRFVVPAANKAKELVVGINRAHLEEDAAKTVHSGGETGRLVGASSSLIDFNRGGTPLVEVVTAPDLRSGEEAKRFLELLRQTVIELGISEAEMEKGTLRVDANVSVRPRGSDELRPRWELKNVNSFNFVGRGIEAAAKAQREAYENGLPVRQQTYDYEPQTGVLHPHRAKEEAEDYRYFPEPDLSPLQPAPAAVLALKQGLPERPGERISRLADLVGFQSAQVLVRAGLDRLFEAVVAAGADAKSAANLIANELLGAGVEAATVEPRQLAQLIEARPRLPQAVFSSALAHCDQEGFKAKDYLKESLLPESALAPLVESVLELHPEQVAAYQSGNEKLLGFLIGETMKAAGGSAEPKAVSELLRNCLAARAMATDGDG